MPRNCAFKTGQNQKARIRNPGISGTMATGVWQGQLASAAANYDPCAAGGGHI